MSQYVDGFVLSIPKDKIDAYREHATKAAAIWKEHGALEYRECLGDDLDVEDQVPFPKMAGTRDDEVVIFAYALYASKEARDEANKRIMSDPRIAEMCGEVSAIIDFKRMAVGGFKTIVHE